MHRYDYPSRFPRRLRSQALVRSQAEPPGVHEGTLDESRRVDVVLRDLIVPSDPAIIR